MRHRTSNRFLLLLVTEQRGLRNAPATKGLNQTTPMQEANTQLTLTFSSLADTTIFGKILGEKAQEGDVILLYGDLGAGKTTLAQSIARGLAVPEDQYVTSPSFALMHEYFGRLPLYHIDCYRLSGENEIVDAGLLDYIVNKDGLCIIEWPERLGTLIPKNNLTVQLFAKNDEQREVTLMAYGQTWARRLQELREDVFFVARLK